MSFAIGENVGPYRIVAQLGSGGMATVYKAYHAALDRYVAIKVMHQALKEDPNFLARFQREARIVAKLDHPHIVPIYDFSEHEGQPYLVMRFIEGETLKAHLQSRRLSISKVMDIIRPVCQALTYAHSHGVLHRDIKPSNIIITTQGQVFLTDFGLAKIAQQGDSTLSRDMMVGTPQYISPEQAQGQIDLDVRTDIYSLGVVLYELLVGRVPFQADTPYAIIHDHIFTPLPMPRSLNPDLPEPFERVLLKALAKERDDRYASVSELQEALEKAVAESTQPLPDAAQSQPVPAASLASATQAAAVSIPLTPQPAVPQAPAAPTRKSHHKLWLALGAIAALVFCCVAALTISNWQVREQLSRARQLRAAGLVDQALAEYEAVRQKQSRLMEAYAEPAEMLIERGGPGDFMHAAKICEQGLKVEPNNVQLRNDAVRAYLAANDFNEAMPHLEWLLKRRPKDSLSHAGMALVLAQRERLDEAEREARTALSLEPDLPEGHLALGIVYAKKGQFPPARDEFRAVLNAPTALPWLKERAQELLDRIR